MKKIPFLHNLTVSVWNTTVVNTNPRSVTSDMRNVSAKYKQNSSNHTIVVSGLCVLSALKAIITTSLLRILSHKMITENKVTAERANGCVQSSTLDQYHRNDTEQQLESCLARCLP